MSALNAHIIRLYDTVFDRAPDAGGLLNWNTAADGGMDLRSIASEFIAAPEFAVTYGQPDNLSFIRSMYENVLDRPGEAGGVSFWTSLLDQGLASRPDIVVGFSESAEHVQQMAANAAAARVSSPGVTSSSEFPTITGTSGNDTIYGTGDENFDPSINYGRFQPGQNYISGGDGDDVVYALSGRDVIRGGAGSDTLHGGLGNDDIQGEGNDDTLVGGPGTDRMSGGDGYDVFVLRPGDGDDVVDGFERGDVIRIEGAPNGGFGFISTSDPSAGSGMHLRFGSDRNGYYADGALLVGTGSWDLWWLEQSVIFA